MDGSGELRELLDRQQIWACLLRYTRGMDRLDAALALSAYHPGAIEDHGAVIQPAEDFVARVLEFHRTRELATQHILSNHSCEIDGDIAHCETYVRCFAVMAEGPHILAFGRFVDRLERRGGRWGITSRVSLPEGAAHLERFDNRAGMTDDPATLAHGARDRSDISYRRPLPNTRD
ncbi:MAG: nuclear transport factor 2 family protein [Sphingomonadales bacterium]|nr:nuclear transport factor 2 family protein [Sphingomonadales bacterium]